MPPRLPLFAGCMSGRGGSGAAGIAAGATPEALLDLLESRLLAKIRAELRQGWQDALDATCKSMRAAIISEMESLRPLPEQVAALRVEASMTAARLADVEERCTALEPQFMSRKAAGAVLAHASQLSESERSFSDRLGREAEERERKMSNILDSAARTMGAQRLGDLSELDSPSELAGAVGAEEVLSPERALSSQQRASSVGRSGAVRSAGCIRAEESLGGSSVNTAAGPTPPKHKEAEAEPTASNHQGVGSQQSSYAAAPIVSASSTSQAMASPPVPKPTLQVAAQAQSLLSQPLTSQQPQVLQPQLLQPSGSIWGQPSSSVTQVQQQPQQPALFQSQAHVQFSQQVQPSSQPVPSSFQLPVGNRAPQLVQSGSLPRTPRETAPPLTRSTSPVSFVRRSALAVTSTSPTTGAAACAMPGNRATGSAMSTEPVAVEPAAAAGGAGQRQGSLGPNTRLQL